MAIAETNHTPSQPVRSEREGATSNSFVGFLDANAHPLQALTERTSNLRELDRRWRSTADIEDLTSEVMIYVYATRSSPMSSGKAKLVRDAIRDGLGIAIFGEAREGQQVQHVFLRLDVRYFLERRLLPSDREQYYAWRDHVIELGDVYRGEKKPLVDGLHEARHEIMQALNLHLAGDIAPRLFAMAAFFKEPTYQRERERIRPFLAALAENVHGRRKNKGESFLDDAWKMYGQYVEGEKEHPSQESFIDTLGLVADPEDRFFQLIQIISAARGEEDLSPGAMMQRENLVAVHELLTKHNLWPFRIKQWYGSDLLQKGIYAVNTIRTALEAYYREPAFSTHGAANLIVEEGTEDVVAAEESEQAEVAPKPAAVLERRQKTMYQVGRIVSDGEVRRKVIFQPFDLDQFIADLASGHAPDDKRMVADIRAMIESVRQVPIGPGVISLTARSVAIEGTPFTPHRLDPGKRANAGLSLSHPKSKQLRLVYLIDRREGEVPTIIIDSLETRDKVYE